MSKWIDIKDKKPMDGQSILAEFKHGIISCQWDERDSVGSTYIWQDFEFYVKRWIALEDFVSWSGDLR